MSILIFYGAKTNVEYQIHNLYFDKIGDDNSFEKSKNFIIQAEAANKSDNLFILGSSELEYSKNYPTHVSNVFNHKAAGFQPYLIGRAGYDQLAHALIVGALGHRLRGKKIVFIISPQWFYGQVLIERNFRAVINPLNYYLFFENDEISLNIKSAVAKELLGIVRHNIFGNFEELRSICQLYLNNDFVSRVKRKVVWPYYKILVELLKFQDGIAAYKLLRKNTVYPVQESGGVVDLDWQAMKDKAFLDAMARSNNNTLFIDDDFWNHQLVDMPHPEGMYRNKMSLHIDNLYLQLDILMRLFHELKLDPLIITIPFQGFWYDLAQLEKPERQYCYDKIDNILRRYNYKTADFLSREYEPYFFLDGFHVGSVGWVYVNEAIYDFWLGKDYMSILH